MMEFPKSAAFGRRIPKQKFYENLEVPASVKQLFVQQIKLIVWAYKLSPETMNIAPGEQVKEIQVFHLKLHGDTIDPQALNLMDKQIPYHILFLLERPDGRTQLWVNYKEANQSGSNAFQLRQSYHTLWLPQEELSLDLSALDMDALYERIVRQIAGDAITAQGENLKAAVEKSRQQEKLQKEIQRLEKLARAEKQPKKKFELVQKINEIKKKWEEAL